MAVLPLETGIYGYLQKPSLVDYPGHITAVYFTSGCNFRCGYCHNAPLLGKRTAGLSAEELKATVKRFKTKDWINGVTVSGGEPTLLEHLPQLIRWFKDQNLEVKLDTNGSNPQMLKGLLPDLDYVAMDIKCALESYPDFVSYHRTDNIQQSVDLLLEWEGHAEFRTTVLEDFHTADQMERIMELIEGADTYTLQPFVPRDNLPDPEMRTKKRTSPDLLHRYAQMMAPCARTVTIKGNS